MQVQSYAISRVSAPRTLAAWGVARGALTLVHADGSERLILLQAACQVPVQTLQHVAALMNGTMNPAPAPPLPESDAVCTALVDIAAPALFAERAAPRQPDLPEGGASTCVIDEQACLLEELSAPEAAAAHSLPALRTHRVRAHRSPAGRSLTLAVAPDAAPLGGAARAAFAAAFAAFSLAPLLAAYVVLKWVWNVEHDVLPVVASRVLIFGAPAALAVWSVLSAVAAAPADAHLTIGPRQWSLEVHARGWEVFSFSGTSRCAGGHTAELRGCEVRPRDTACPGGRPVARPTWLAQRASHRAGHLRAELLGRVEERAAAAHRAGCGAGLRLALRGAHAARKGVRDARGERGSGGPMGQWRGGRGRLGAAAD